MNPYLIMKGLQVFPFPPHHTLHCGEREREEMKSPTITKPFYNLSYAITQSPNSLGNHPKLPFRVPKYLRKEKNSC